MKVNGVDAKKVTAWEPDPLVLDRGRDEHGEKVFLVFRARGVKTYDEFEALCPEPKNTQGYMTREGWQIDPEAPVYVDEMKRWRQQRWAYTIIKTLEPSNIEWEKVKIAAPKTWHHFKEELRLILSDNELGRLYGLIHEANVLNQEKLEENKQSFFQLQAKLRGNQTGQNGGPGSSSPSEPASARE